MLSYINKKTRGMKNMIILTTMQDKIKVINNQRRKPKVHVIYDLRYYFFTLYVPMGKRR